MRKIFALWLTLALLGTPAAGASRPALEVEGCQVANPGQPACTYTVTHAGATPVSGATGFGQWVVKVKVGKKATVYKSPSSGAPAVEEFALPEGAKVTMTALTPGSGGTVGHVD